MIACKNIYNKIVGESKFNKRSKLNIFIQKSKRIGKGCWLEVFLSNVILLVTINSSSNCFVGSNGFENVFFQTSWDDIKEDLPEVVQDSFDVVLFLGLFFVLPLFPFRRNITTFHGEIFSLLPCAHGGKNIA